MQADPERDDGERGALVREHERRRHHRDLHAPLRREHRDPSHAPLRVTEEPPQAELTCPGSLFDALLVVRIEATQVGGNLPRVRPDPSQQQEDPATGFSLKAIGQREATQTRRH